MLKHYQIMPCYFAQAILPLTKLLCTVCTVCCNVSKKQKKTDIMTNSLPPLSACPMFFFSLMCDCFSWPASLSPFSACLVTGIPCGIMLSGNIYTIYPVECALANTGNLHSSPLSRGVEAVDSVALKHS